MSRFAGVVGLVLLIVLTPEARSAAPPSAPEGVLPVGADGRPLNLDFDRPTPPGPRDTQHSTRSVGAPDEQVRALISYLQTPVQVPMLATADNAGDLFNGKDLSGPMEVRFKDQKLEVLAARK
jgi:hypothetical protein